VLLDLLYILGRPFAASLGVYGLIALDELMRHPNRLERITTMSAAEEAVN
jgi:hypothetical protein